MPMENNLRRVEGQSPTGKDGRQSQRFRVLLNAELITTTEEQPVKVRDISRTGAMMEGQRPIAKARDVILRRGNVEIFAEIVWTDGKQCGVQFDEELSEEEMLAFVHEAARRAAFVPAPFRQVSDVAIEGPATAGAVNADAFRYPIGRGIFGR